MVISGALPGEPCLIRIEEGRGPRAEPRLVARFPTCGFTYSDPLDDGLDSDPLEEQAARKALDLETRARAELQKWVERGGGRLP